jgi:CheY-like chemotaxis protein/HD-like signal output (HDOD) protein
MTKILLADDRVVFRDAIAASLRKFNFQTLVAGDGEEAIRVTEQHRPDIILLDVSMPRLDGISFLRRLRANPRLAGTKVILLTALSDKKYVLAAAELGIRDYLLKSRFRLADLLDRIAKLCPKLDAPDRGDRGEPAHADAPTGTPPQPVPGASTTPPPANATGPAAAPAGAPAGAPAQAMPPAQATPPPIPVLMTRQQCLRKIERLLQAKALSGVITQVISVASSPRSGTNELAKVIQQDPMLSARVLRVANSAAFASPGPPVSTIPEAIRKIGCGTIRNIAAALGIVDTMGATGSDGYSPIRSWQHSFAVAQLCERLAGPDSGERAGVAYLVGLCHDLGDIFIRSQFGEEYRKLLETSAATGIHRDELHEKMLGVTRLQMMSEVLKFVGLPATIREPIELFHANRGYRLTDPNAMMLHLADLYANGSLLASGPESVVTPLTTSFCQTATGEAHPTGPDAKALQSQVLSLTAMLAKMTADEEARMMTPLFKHGSARLWIARDESVSAFDPVSLAAGALHQTVCQTRLPDRNETDEIDGLILLTATPAECGFELSGMERTSVPRGGGRPALPVLGIAAKDAQGTDPMPVRWREGVTLGELAAFVAGPSRQIVNRAA